MSYPSILILSGGQGSRLWPLTAQNVPKALLCLDNSEVSLLRKTINRAKHLTLPKGIFISAGRSHEVELKRQADEIPYENLIFEPTARGTLPCIGFSALYMKRQSQSEIMITMPGEQLIKDDIAFRDVMFQAVYFAEKFNTVVALGIKPTFPATRFGYIKIGKQASCNDGFAIFESEGFTEKPDEKKALDFLSSGKYLWNSGIYTFPISWLFEMIAKFTPDVHEKLVEIEESIGTAYQDEVIGRVYPEMRNISVDYAVMERAENMLVMPTDTYWNDMGTWTEVSETWETDQHSNSHHGEYISIDSNECIIYAHKKVVAIIGVQNVIIIDTPDGLLVCDKNRADDVKLIAQKIKLTKGEKL
jgi:mannose-1-phosphate guanylyltransferase